MPNPYSHKPRTPTLSDFSNEARSGHHDCCVSPAAPQTARVLLQSLSMELTSLLSPQRGKWQNFITLLSAEFERLEEHVSLASLQSEQRHELEVTEARLAECTAEVTRLKEENTFLRKQTVEFQAQKVRVNDNMRETTTSVAHSRRDHSLATSTGARSSKGLTESMSTSEEVHQSVIHSSLRMTSDGDVMPKQSWRQSFPGTDDMISDTRSIKTGVTTLPSLPETCEFQFSRPQKTFASSQRSHGIFSHGSRSLRSHTRSQTKFSNRHSSKISSSANSSMSGAQAHWLWRRFRRASRFMVHTRAFRAVEFIALFFALLGGGLWQIFDIRDDFNTILDVAMTTVMAWFLFEIAAHCMAQISYRCSFFFWMDVLGTVSMMFEISFILGNIMNTNTVVLRTARTAKLGARIGRLLKVLKYLLRPKSADKNLSEAAILQKKLLFRLSTQVSILAITLVMVIPLFQLPLYPQQDMSMELWAQRLELAYHNSVQSNLPTAFQSDVSYLQQFYEDEWYFPFDLEGFGPHVYEENNVEVSSLVFGWQGILPKREEPHRKDNIVKKMVDSCRVVRNGCIGSSKASIHFDFTLPHQWESVMEILMIFFAISIMALMTFFFNREVDVLMVKPLERMLHNTRVQACNIFDKFNATLKNPIEHEQELNDVMAHEIDMLEAILDKLAVLVKFHVDKNEVDERQLSMMDKDEQAVLVDMLAIKVVPRKTRKGSAFYSARCSRASTSSQGLPSSADSSDKPMSPLPSWGVDIFGLADASLQDSILQIFLKSDMAYADLFAERECFMTFIESIKAAYKDLPYHCFHHACDVLFTIYRILLKTHSQDWLKHVHEYALLIAAFAHDIGHFGRTNSFIVVTRHELALLYNDISPMENMHCARLFRICKNPDADAFGKASAEQRIQARKACVSAILHTDNANHFDMVKRLSSTYEVHSDICDSQASSPEMLPSYLEHILEGEDQTLWMDAFLHFADISNPLKPFDIGRSWATRVLEEFFQQGDEEKRLGIPVGLLNDRETVNKAGSQHGFINVFVAPYTHCMVNIFPTLVDLHSQMVSNLDQWKELWIQESNPSIDEVLKKDGDAHKVKKINEDLQRRSQWRPAMALHKNGSTMFVSASSPPA